MMIPIGPLRLYDDNHAGEKGVQTGAKWKAQEGTRRTRWLHVLTLIWLSTRIEDDRIQLRSHPTGTIANLAVQQTRTRGLKERTVRTVDDETIWTQRRTLNRNGLGKDQIWERRRELKRKCAEDMDLTVWKFIYKCRKRRADTLTTLLHAHPQQPQTRLEVQQMPLGTGVSGSVAGGGKSGGDPGSA